MRHLNLQWILHPEYLSACYTALQVNPSTSSSGNFLSEEEYEWGHENYSGILTGGQGDWARAGRRSRLRPDRPFSSVQALIFGSTTPPAETLLRMVVSGGGTAVIVSDLSAAQLLCGDNNDTDMRRHGWKDDGSGVRGTIEIGEGQVGAPTARTVHPSLRYITSIIASSRSDDDDKHLRELCTMLASWGITVPVQSPSHLLDSLCAMPPAESILDSSTAHEKIILSSERVGILTDSSPQTLLAKGRNTSKRRKLSQSHSATSPSLQ